MSPLSVIRTVVGLVIKKDGLVCSHWIKEGAMMGCQWTDNDTMSLVRTTEEANSYHVYVKTKIQQKEHTYIHTYV